MPLTRPTLAQLKERVLGDIKSRLGLSILLPRSILGVIANVLAGASHELHGFIQYMSRQLFVDTAEAEFLQRHASTYKVTRIPATYATGSLNFVGVGGTVVPAGTIIQRNDGIQFSVNADTTVSGSGPTQTQAVAVTCLTPGSTGNTVASTSMTLITTITDIQTVVSVASGAITGGVDEESDASLRARTLSRIQQPPHGGADFDYVAWAKSIAGITRAYCKPLWMGLGTVGVCVIADDIDEAPIPTTGMVEDVQEYIDTVKPVGHTVYVFAPTPKPVNMTIQLLPNSDSVKAAVVQELKDMLRRDMEPGSTLRRSRIIEAISIAAGESYNVLTVPSGDTTSANYELITLGTITWTT